MYSDVIVSQLDMKERYEGGTRRYLQLETVHVTVTRKVIGSSKTVSSTVSREELGIYSLRQTETGKK